MTDANKITVEESRAQLIGCINDVRADAHKIETVAAAVDYAIQGTLAVTATAIAVAGEESLVLKDFANELAATWAETVNS